MQDFKVEKFNGPNSRETAKLTSLLALAAGAVACPQPGHADIIYTSLGPSGYAVGFTANESLQFVVPGDANVGFKRVSSVSYTSPGSLTINIRLVLAGDLGGGAGGGFNGTSVVAPKPFGAAWDNPALLYNVPVAWVNDVNGSSGTSDFDHQYYAWMFNDSTQGGAARYGWAEVSLAMAGYNAGGPTLTVWAYAYDNTGLKPTMGAIPEPTSTALLALGAMALGARGVRKWRQDRKPLRSV